MRAVDFNRSTSDEELFLTVVRNARSVRNVTGAGKKSEKKS
jgi:hypothetical protein